MTKVYVPRNLREAYRFFLAHAGYVVGRRKQGALDLARAEQEARERGWLVWWETRLNECLCEDDGPHASSEGACIYAPGQIQHDVPKSSAVPLASLGAICGPTREYRRVVEAELALEAIAELRRIGRWEDPTV